MNKQTSILADAALDVVSGGGKIGDAAQKVSGLFKTASDIGHGSTDQTVFTVAGSVGGAAVAGHKPA